MKHIALADFGASRVKCVIVDIDTNTVVDSIDVVSPSSKHTTTDSTFEIAPTQYWHALEKTAGVLIAKYSVQDLWICSEMHGFVLVQDQQAVTGYISWKDQRATHKLDVLNKRSQEFTNATGMRLRAGLPVVTASAMNLPLNAKLHTLVDWLLLCGGVSDPKSHVSLSAGTGFYDINQGVCTNDFLQTNLEFCRVTTDVKECLGQITLLGNTINVYGGIGDLQAALYGAGLAPGGAVVNLGTGSQVAVLPANPGNELRPFVHGDSAGVVTHIPGGRALNVVADLFDNIAVLAGGAPIFWHLWSQLDVDEVLASALHTDLNLFDAAWRHSATSGFIGLREHSSHPQQVLSGVARSWAQQYIDALDLLDPNHDIASVTLTGGLARKSRFLVALMLKLDATRTYRLADNITGEDTLDGLLKMCKETQ